MKVHIYNYKSTSLLSIKKEAIELLKQLICIPSYSKEEGASAEAIYAFLMSKGIKSHISLNNIWCTNHYFDASKPSILLNSHHDTVKPNKGYTIDPFHALEENGKLYGLGSNDAGGALVSLMSVFRYFYMHPQLPFNLVFVASAEEEISGTNGIAYVLKDLPPIDFALVGEPTLMQMAVAEKGLMVLDAMVEGKAGHAARNEGDNAIYKAIPIIQWFQNFKFEKKSELLGDVKMNVTMVHAGEQHNVTPAQCQFTVDVRTTDAYTNQETLDIIKRHVPCQIKERSLRLQPSSISLHHPFVKEGIRFGIGYYGSPTTSDQALLNMPSLKMGPGDSARSHMANEFIYVSEIEDAIDTYIHLFNQLQYHE